MILTEVYPGTCGQFRVIANYLIALNIPAYNSVEHRQPLRSISSRAFCYFYLSSSRINNS
jgi:hypothetical protein